MKRYVATMILLILVISISIYYTFFKENEVEVNIEKSKYLIQQRIRNIDIENVPKSLQIEFEKILLKNNTLELKKEWSTNLDFDLTLKPFFDLNNIYLISYDKIIVYSKKNSEIKWKRKLDQTIVYFNLLDRNRVIACDDSLNFYNLRRSDGELIWKTNYQDFTQPSINTGLRPFLITPSQDKRLLYSIFFIPKKKGIMLINNDTGQLISSIEFDAELLFISEYNAFDNSLYVATELQLIKLKLEKP
ncbi:MAG TPA: hypothetical protein PL063_01560 [Candidatus Cloacimonadota bacterium]|nr:hypothetical protein [Candidatus Cloacimonadales bacterium]HPY95880.1 hypothetical protein [Candidatus Cloacimonadota bacterium]HQB41495.1 hypothetical protein [Candidatus Cloacimonadota bacterium]